MIDQVSQQLLDWLRKIDHGFNVVLSAPGNINKKPAISLYLLDILPSANTTSSRRLPIQFKLRYLVTTWADIEQDAHRTLANIIYEAMDWPDFEIKFESLSAQMWNSFGVAPRPCFMIEVPVQLERQQKKVPVIESPIELQFKDTVALDGIVLGPHKTSIAGANIILSNHGLQTRSDINGRFSFQLVPQDPLKKQLIIQTRSNDFNFEVDTSIEMKHPIRIELNSEEE